MPNSSVKRHVNHNHSSHELIRKQFTQMWVLSRKNYEQFPAPYLRWAFYKSLPSQLRCRWHLTSVSQIDRMIIMYLLRVKDSCEMWLALCRYYWYNSRRSWPEREDLSHQRIVPCFCSLNNKVWNAECGTLKGMNWTSWTNGFQLIQ